jgi:hypothetical protein
METLLSQNSALQEYERSQVGKATARRVETPQQVDAAGMRMNSVLWIPERTVELQLRLCVEVL